MGTQARPYFNSTAPRGDVARRNKILNEHLGMNEKEKKPRLLTHFPQHEFTTTSDGFNLPVEKSMERLQHAFSQLWFPLSLKLKLILYKHSNSGAAG